MSRPATNDDRAGWAKVALEAFKGCHLASDDDKENIRDLIVDLLHLARIEHGESAMGIFAQGAADTHDAELTEELDDDTCRTCGVSYEDGGDGFDGECPDCADKTDQKLHPENYED